MVGRAAIRDVPTRLFRRAGYDIGEVEDGEAALVELEERHPHLVVVDRDLPDMSGYELTYEVRERFGADPSVIMLSETRDEPHDKIAGLLIGADDYLYVDESFRSDELLARARRLLADPVPSERHAYRLTPREIEVLQHLASGLGREVMAKKLYISPKTVATHIQHILTKLGVRSTAEAVAFAYRNGLVDEQP